MIKCLAKELPAILEHCQNPKIITTHDDNHYVVDYAEEMNGYYVCILDNRAVVAFHPDTEVMVE